MWYLAILLMMILGVLLFVAGFCFAIYLEHPVNKERVMRVVDRVKEGVEPKKGVIEVSRVNSKKVISDRKRKAKDLPDYLTAIDGRTQK